ncbi:MAG: PadR family transcriptional regulator [Gemmatimonadaceae bacterium]
MTSSDASVDALIPLPPATFHILIALATGELHGYGIIQDIESRTGGELRMSAGTLYRTIQRLVEQGVIVETVPKPAPIFDDERRRYYRITPFGEAVARGESARMSELLRFAKSAGLNPKLA